MTLLHSRAGRRLNYPGRADLLCPSLLGRSVPQPDTAADEVLRAKGIVDYAPRTLSNAFASVQIGVSKPSVDQP
jgi:hypothetical protein